MLGWHPDTEIMSAHSRLTTAPGPLQRKKMRTIRSSDQFVS
jgi:hypothetical protein